MCFFALDGDDERGHGREHSFRSPTTTTGQPPATTSSPCKRLMIKASLGPLNLRFASDKDMQNSFLMRIAAGFFALKKINRKK